MALASIHAAPITRSKEEAEKLMQSTDSADMTRVGPGTVMGTMMRQYWLPACLSSEVKADGDPVRLMLLGEKLIAFRDTSGSVGIMDAARTAAPRCFRAEQRRRHPLRLLRLEV